MPRVEKWRALKRFSAPIKGRRRYFDEGDIFMAQKTEVSHILGMVTRATEYDEEAAEAEEMETGANFKLDEHIGGGYFSVAQDGETVTLPDGEAVKIGRGKEEAARKLADCENLADLYDISTNYEH